MKIVNKSGRLGPPENEHTYLQLPMGEAIIVFADGSFGKSAYPYGGGFSWWQNSVLSWFAQKPKFAPDSTCMMEMDMLVRGLKNALFDRNVLEDMHCFTKAPHVISDSKSAIDIIRNPGVTKRSAHYERRLFFARDAYLYERMVPFLCPTDKMMADMMTKVVDKNKFFLCRNYMMNL